MDKRKLDKIKEALPFGAQADAARMFHISPSAVSQIISGTSENYNILEYLIARATKYQSQLKKIEKEMEELK
jgi:predicted transcriptional regulator